MDICNTMDTTAVTLRCNARDVVAVDPEGRARGAPAYLLDKKCVPTVLHMTSEHFGGLEGTLDEANDLPRRSLRIEHFTDLEPRHGLFSFLNDWPTC
jgi:hypothetical protein